MNRLLALASLLLWLAGCGGVVPARVQYAEYPKEAISKAGGDTGGYQFRHRRSVIMLDYKGDKGFQATAVPYELTGGSYNTLYRIWGIDNYRSTTQLRVTYIDNTKFIDQLQVTTKDNLSDTISKIGEVAKALVPIVAAFVSTPAKVTELKFNKTMVDPAEIKLGQWTDDPLNEGYCVRLKDVVSESALSFDQYVKAGFGEWQNTFPVPACATGVLEIASPCTKPDDNIKASFRITFADATTVLPMSLPSSGSLKMNTVCGASVTEADKQDRTELLDYLKTAVTQIQDVSAAWKKAKGGTGTAEKATTEKPKTEKPEAEKPKTGK